MEDSLVNLLHSRTVLIKTSYSVGTGFFISENTILTCAHVVRDEFDYSKIRILAPLDNFSGQFEKTIRPFEVYLSKKYETKIGEQNYETEYPDIAVLLLDHNDAPKNQRFIKIKSSKESLGDYKHYNSYWDGKRFLAYGFQKKLREHKNNVPEAVGLTYNGWTGQKAKTMSFLGGLIRPGMSGAALLDRDDGSLVGIIHKTRNPHSDMGALVIPTQVIWGVFKDWKYKHNLGIYDTLNDGYHKYVVKKQYKEDYPNYSIWNKHFWNILGFSTLLILLVIWIFTHLVLINESENLNILLFALSLVTAFIGTWLGQNLKSETDLLKSSIGWYLMRWETLAVLGFFVIFLWTFTTSIWIHHKGEEADNVPVVLYDSRNLEKGNKDTLRPTKSLRYLKFINPFSIDLSIKVLNQTPKNVDIQLFRRNELFYPSSFDPEPILIIPFQNSYEGLLESYHIKICHYKAGLETNKTEHLERDINSYGSIIIGAKDTIYESTIRNMFEKWYLDEFRNNNNDTFEGKWDFWKKKHLKKIDLDVGDKIIITPVSNNETSILHTLTYEIKKINRIELLRFDKKHSNNGE